MDALSAALNSVRMTGAIFFNAICTAPWGFAVPPLKLVAHALAPGTERLVSYHLVTEGKAVVGFDDGEEVSVMAGDIVIIPHGEAHTIKNGFPPRLIETGESLGEYLAGTLSTMRVGSGGEVTHFVCGYFGCDRHADRLFLAGLPQMIKLNIRGDAAGEWLETSIRHLVCEADSKRPGTTVLLSKMAEALFIETLRRYMERLPPEQVGWLAGARDPIVGAALALMHGSPCHPWTVRDLASEVGTSRSVLTERFARFLDESPLAYLARWRLQLAARRLQTTRNTVLQVASDVGYESEAAFNRAFKREYGLPPAQYRRAFATPAAALPTGKPAGAPDTSVSA
jgi:AraC-like DNA-binding protein